MGTLAGSATGHGAEISQRGAVKHRKQGKSKYFDARDGRATDVVLRGHAEGNCQPKVLQGDIHPPVLSKYCRISPWLSAGANPG